MNKHDFPNTFGYIFFPEKKRKKIDTITQLQEINYETINHITIKNIIEQIPNYEKYYITISEECSVMFKKVGDEFIAECDYTNDAPNQYILLNIPRNTISFFDALLNKHKSPSHVLSQLTGSFHYLLHALEHLIRKQIIHFDIKPENILLDETTETPRLSYFGKSIQVHMISSQNIKSHFYTTANSIGED